MATLLEFLLKYAVQSSNHGGYLKLLKVIQDCHQNYCFKLFILEETPNLWPWKYDNHNTLWYCDVHRTILRNLFNSNVAVPFFANKNIFAKTQCHRLLYDSSIRVKLMYRITNQDKDLQDKSNKEIPRLEIPRYSIKPDNFFSKIFEGILQFSVMKQASPLLLLFKKNKFTLFVVQQTKLCIFYDEKSSLHPVKRRTLCILKNMFLILNRDKTFDC